MAALGSIRRAGLWLALVGALTACKTPEQRAAAHFQAGMVHLEAGDTDRALVEFRNVFKLNPGHTGARLAYARAEQARGSLSEAYAHYLHLAEYDPGHLESRRALAEMALDQGEREEAARHAAAAAALAPGDLRVQSVQNSLSYLAAVQAGDQERQAAAAARAEDLAAAQPGLKSARQVLIEHSLRQRDWPGALAALGTALAEFPGDPGLYALKLSVLQEQGDAAALRAHLEEMVQRFPADAGLRQALVRHHIAADDLAAAEAVLRQEAGPPPGAAGPVQRLAAFLGEFQGPQAAVAELDRRIGADGPDTLAFAAMRAQLMFRNGDEAAAIDGLRALLATAPRDAQARQAGAGLAQMLDLSGSSQAARALVAQILQEDPAHPGAVKLQARWLIGDGAPGDAIVLLREALGQAPQDADLMTLMAAAHERAGHRPLMGEMLALAVEVSGGAPAETARYARYLLAEGNVPLAVSVLTGALQAAPDDLALLTLLGQAHLAARDWGQVQALAARLDRLGSPGAEALARDLRSRRQAALQAAGALAAVVERLMGDPKAGAAAGLTRLRAPLARGDAAAAHRELTALLEKGPPPPGLRFLQAYVLALDGQAAEAEAGYRALTAELPDWALPWLALYRLKQAQGQAGAAEVLEQALAALPGDRELLWAKAGALERSGRMEAAIAVYETLYARNPASLALANNLASLLASHRSDAASLARAGRIARRLRDTDFGPYLDTYGWVALRRGETALALRYLQRAAAALPEHAEVQYHLAQALAAAGREDEARAALEAALALTDPDNPPPFLSAAADGGLPGTAASQ
ncbi:tetratricopeptide repeat protein (plasmid) [Roseobacteraceae bacterium NS-SX3]